MLISTPPVNSHQLTNNLPSSNTLHSSLPSSFPTLTTSNPLTWTTKDVEEWLIKNDLNDCVELICSQHRMNGQRLMNLKENDILQLNDIGKNHQLWGQIKKIQQIYSSNYHLWTPRQQTTVYQQQKSTPPPQNIPMTASSYFAPSLTQATIALRPLSPATPIRSIPTSLPIPAPPKMSSVQPATPSSSYTTILINSNSSTVPQPSIVPQQQQQLPQQHQRNASYSTSNNVMQTATPSTSLLERSPLTVTRSTNNQQYQRRSLSHSLSVSNASINILPPSSNQRPTNALLSNHRTPSDQIEDPLITSCCCIGSIPADRKKTLSAFLLALCTLYFCSFVITIVDERLPDPKEFKPLPDLILENIKQIPWAFAVTEKIILIEMLTLCIFIIFHRHRMIILRRLFAIAAALYFLRSLTMVLTSLPVATSKTDCRPEKLTSLLARLKKATLIFVGQGMSSFGVKTCGDYLFSGHTCTLVLATHFINEYSPRSYHLLHFLSWILSITGMFCILAGHQHYSIDILIAWVLSSRLFIYYHTLANNRTYFQRDKNRMRIWFPFFSYFEENVKQAIPNEYCLPAFICEARTKLTGCVDRMRYSTD